ncbi:ArnT family glycosyltransferase [Sphingomonas sp.]|uniref:ArnT family glycosyltransferase n=1 Tax=Sphingomonas sp. TaxID=28214 RepID=UPI00389FAAF4
MRAGTRAVPRRTAFTFAALAVWLLAIALVRPLSVDESQYVASTALAAEGLLPYRDFAYLQTPLQPLVFAPLQWLFAGHLLLAMRIANALLGLVTVMLVYGAARRAGASERSALTASAMLVACESFAWCVGVARNDLLPAALLSLGLWLIVRGGGWTRLGAGLAFGLAASAKISYAVPAAAVFLAGVWTADAAERRRQLCFAGGVAIGLLPTFVLAALAPRAFLAEAIIFPARAPAQYYTEIGKAWRLGPARFGELLIAAAVGPALIASVEIARRSWAEPGRWLGDSVRRTMIAAAIGGVVSAGLNKPFQIFYLLPALPPLFVLTALVSGEGAARRRWWLGAWALFIAAGFVPVAGWFVHAAIHGMPPALDAERRSEALGNALRAQHVHRPIATLAGQYVPTGYSVDPRFAAGPFLYRTRGFVAPEQAREWRIVTRDQTAILAERPPGAIVTGTYPDSQPDLETQLAAQAKALGYRQAAQVDGFTLWVRR